MDYVCDMIEKHHAPGYNVTAKVDRTEFSTSKTVTRGCTAWDKDTQWVFRITRDGLIKVAEMPISGASDPREYWIKLDDLNCMGNLYIQYTTSVCELEERLFGEDVFSRNFAEDSLLVNSKEEYHELLKQYLASSPLWVAAKNDDIPDDVWINRAQSIGKFINVRMQFEIVEKYGSHDLHRQRFIGDFVEFINGLMEAQDPGPRSRRTKVVLKFDLMDWERFIGKKYNPELLYQRDYSDMYE